MTMGGEHWGTLAATTLTDGYSLALLGRDTGDNRDLWIASDNSEKGNGAFKTALTAVAIPNVFVSALQGAAFVEVQDAADGPWDGAHIRSQEAAQRSLTAISEAIQRKDSIRANLGALQNLLESTMETLSIQVENLQAAESRISDVDVALEMTNFMKQNILAQAATAMLAQANSLSSLALTLIVGA
jgi:flagellin